MGLNAAALRLLAEKGLSAADIADVAEAMEVRADPTAAERMRRHRAKKAVTRNVTDERYDERPPNEYISNPPVTPDAAKAACPPLVDRVVEAWNAGPKAKGATGAAKLDANRRKMLSLRIREHGEQAVFTAIANLAASPFHCGTNDRGWRANIGWLLKSPENFLKALEMGPPANGSHAAPAFETTQAWNAYCDEQAARFRSTNRERDAVEWERKRKPVDPPRDKATGPPRTPGQIIANLGLSH